METQEFLVLMSIAFIASLSAVGMLFALFGDRLFGRTRFEQRILQVKRGGISLDAETAEKLKGLVSQQRRRRMQEKLRALEEGRKDKGAFTRAGIETRLQQAGHPKATVRQFWMFCFGCGAVTTGIFALVGAPWYALILIAFSATVGLPQWLVAMRIRRRRRLFLRQFADALDVMVRGVRAGLPLIDCLKIVAREGSEPTRSEFDTMAKSLSVGITLAQAVEQFHDRLPLAEVNFFAVVLTLQQQTGGNLSEALANLSNVLRERQHMRQKVSALSQEAQYSAIIIGALPFLIMLVVYVMTPEYLTPLFETTLGNVALIGALLWMGVGGVVMRSMMTFDI